MKRIYCTVTNDLNYDQRMIRICSTLSEHDFSVTLVGRVLSNSNPLDKHPYQQERLRCRFNSGPLFYLEYNLRLLFYFIATKPEVINSIDLDTCIAAKLYRLLARPLWIIDAHEYFPEVPELEGRRLKKRLWEIVESFSIRSADKVYTVSQSIAEIYQKKYRKKIEVIRNVPFLRYSNVVKPNSAKSDSGILLYQGALNAGRCVDLYIRAMTQLEGELWLAGEGDLSSELRALASVLGVSERVRFLGRISPEELRQFTAKAWLGLNVLENKGLSYFYSLSNKCFDYVMAGIPQIGSDFPEYQKLNEQYEVMELIEPKLDVFVNVVKQLQSDKARYQYLCAQCKPAAAKWNWEYEKEKLLAQYE